MELWCFVGCCLKIDTRQRDPIGELTVYVRWLAPILSGSDGSGQPAIMSAEVLC